MSTDRELIELAAKAAGIRARIDPYGKWRDCTGGDPAMNIFAAPLWNPITDDGDALRLAVKLRLDVMQLRPSGACALTDDEKFNSHYVSYKDHEDEYAATRRAIVRAAAAIGEQR